MQSIIFLCFGKLSMDFWLRQCACVLTSSHQYMMGSSQWNCFHSFFVTCGWKIIFVAHGKISLKYLLGCTTWMKSEFPQLCLMVSLEEMLHPTLTRPVGLHLLWSYPWPLPDDNHLNRCNWGAHADIHPWYKHVMTSIAKIYIPTGHGLRRRNYHRCNGQLAHWLCFCTISLCLNFTVCDMIINRLEMIMHVWQMASWTLHNLIRICLHACSE